MKNLQEDLTRRLCDSVDRLQKQVQTVEFWASAVTGLAQPVPDYEPESTKVARYVKARPLPRKRRRRVRGKATAKTETDVKPASA